MMITHAAIRIGSETFTGRGHAEIKLILLAGGTGMDEGEYGFVTDRGVFLDRREAYRHAAECGQVKWGLGGEELQSWMYAQGE